MRSVAAAQMAAALERTGIISPADCCRSNNNMLGICIDTRVHTWVKRSHAARDGRLRPEMIQLLIKSLIERAFKV